VHRAGSGSRWRTRRLSAAALTRNGLSAQLHEGLLVASESEAADNARLLPAAQAAEHFSDQRPRMLLVNRARAATVTVTPWMQELLMLCGIT
jgi:hypothetical protein